MTPGHFGNHRLGHRRLGQDPRLLLRRRGPAAYIARDYFHAAHLHGLRVKRKVERRHKPFSRSCDPGDSLRLDPAGRWGQNTAYPQYWVVKCETARRWDPKSSHALSRLLCRSASNPPADLHPGEEVDVPASVRLLLPKATPSALTTGAPPAVPAPPFQAPCAAPL